MNENVQDKNEQKPNQTEKWNELGNILAERERKREKMLNSPGKY